MPVHVLASIVPVAVNELLRMHICTGRMPGFERPAKQLHLHACTHVPPGSEQLVTCARQYFLHRVKLDHLWCSCVVIVCW